MRIPQPPERVKEAPAHALRAVFAGVGQVLLMTERVRQRTIGQVHTGPAPAPEAAAPEAAVPEAATPEVTAPGAAAPEAAAPEVTAPGAAVPETALEAAAPEATVSEVVAADLPVPNYSELSVASLRARLRGLDAGQVRALLEYERAHAGRANVITMFERRIAKLEGSDNADSAAR